MFWPTIGLYAIFGGFFCNQDELDSFFHICTFSCYAHLKQAGCSKAKLLTSSLLKCDSYTTWLINLTLAHFMSFWILFAFNLNCFPQYGYGCSAKHQWVMPNNKKVYMMATKDPHLMLPNKYFMFSQITRIITLHTCHIWVYTFINTV